MGIGGSGMSAVAQIAHSQGYHITGCDLKLDTPYINKIKKLGISVLSGHSADHLNTIDILAVTPAAFYLNPDHPELIEGRRRNILMKWQEFMSTYLHKNKFVICVAGTHGKSTTTAWVGHLLENAKMDPTVEIGATDNLWKNNVRVGKSKYFVSEADEFHDNFSSYRPDIIILNNLEMDHPEYFDTQEKLLTTYQNFLDHLKTNGLLIFNANSPLIQKLKLPQKSIPYSLSEFPRDVKLSVPGDHNKSNAMGIIKLAKHLKINDELINKSLTNFQGVGRRIELLGEKRGVKVYDDYANHPTAFAAVLSALHKTFRQSRLIAVIEPHTFSRLRTLLPELPASLKLANEIIISKIFPSRETDPGDFSGTDIAKAINGKYIPEFPDIVNTIKSEVKSGDVVVVMGSGNSYKLSKQILDSL